MEKKSKLGQDEPYPNTEFIVTVSIMNVASSHAHNKQMRVS
jgi:hypothetical protein